MNKVWVQAENRGANFSAYFFGGSFLSAGNLGRERFLIFFENIDICRSWNLNEEILG
jgi:hypothetical protein